MGWTTFNIHGNHDDGPDSYDLEDMAKEKARHAEALRKKHIIHAAAKERDNFVNKVNGISPDNLPPQLREALDDVIKSGRAFDKEIAQLKADKAYDMLPLVTAERLEPLSDKVSAIAKINDTYQELRNEVVALRKEHPNLSPDIGKQVKDATALLKKLGDEANLDGNNPFEKDAKKLADVMDRIEGSLHKNLIDAHKKVNPIVAEFSTEGEPGDYTKIAGFLREERDLKSFLDAPRFLHQVSEDNDSNFKQVTDIIRREEETTGVLESLKARVIHDAEKVGMKDAVKNGTLDVDAAVKYAQSEVRKIPDSASASNRDDRESQNNAAALGGVSSNQAAKWVRDDIETASHGKPSEFQKVMKELLPEDPLLTGIITGAQEAGPAGRTVSPTSVASGRGRDSGRLMGD